jgi:hypothetical protein
MDRTPAVFFSYVRADDERERRRLSDLRKALEAELTGLSGDVWKVFQDVEDIQIGQEWRKRLDEGLSGSTFFLPVLTPTYLKRGACRDELVQFLVREKELGRNDLVFPLLYLDTPALTNEAAQQSDELANTLAARQCDDWRELRVNSLESAKVRRRITALARAILAAYSRNPVVTSDTASRPLPSSTAENSLTERRQASWDTTSSQRLWAFARRLKPDWRVIVGICTAIGVIGVIWFVSKCEKPLVSSIGMPLQWVEPLKIWVGKYEVTQAEFLAVMVKVPGYFKGDRRPADRISLAEAKEFCLRLTERDKNAGILPPGMAYRLPKDQEYDVYAADAQLKDAVITGENVKPGQTSDVGSLRPNRYCLYDIRGNVWEWMSEGVLRGACWDNYDAQSLALAYRLPPNPLWPGENFGFRCVLAPVLTD